MGVCVTSLMLAEDAASAVEFCDKGDSLRELKVWALWTSGVTPGAVGVTSDVGAC